MLKHFFLSLGTSLLTNQSMPQKNLTPTKRWFVLFLTLASAMLASCGGTTPTQSLQHTQAATNLQWAEKLMAEVSKQPNIQVISPQLAYRVIESGYGCKPTPNSMITVHYEAKLAQSNQVIDSSFARGRPDRFPLNRMVKAWKQALPLMSEGDAWQLYVHPDLAYGAKGSGPSIPPNSAFVFTVKLIKAGTCAYNFTRK